MEIFALLYLLLELFAWCVGALGWVIAYLTVFAMKLLFCWVPGVWDWEP